MKHLSSVRFLDEQPTAVAQSETISGMEHRLRELRNEKGWSQEKLGELVGATKGQISKLENGRTQINGPWLRRLCDALGCQPADFFQRVDATLTDVATALPDGGNPPSVPEETMRQEMDRMWALLLAIQGQLALMQRLNGEPSPERRDPRAGADVSTT